MLLDVEIFILTFLEIKETPGPGTYKLPSAFDKFKRLPAKHYQSLKASGGLDPKMGHNRSRSGDDEYNTRAFRNNIDL